VRFLVGNFTAFKLCKQNAPSNTTLKVPSLGKTSYKKQTYIITAKNSNLRCMRIKYSPVSYSKVYDAYYVQSMHNVVWKLPLVGYRDIVMEYGRIS
jgi:hypothetical protein